MNLADNLKKIRKDNNLSQEQLAEKLGVSRQSVSKWESGISYPEMDKVLQICQLFNLNINEFINEDIKEVTELKEAQNRTNKYISSFFDYITKVVDMFSSMTGKQRIRCLFEQVIVFLLMLLLYFILGIAGDFIINSLLQLLPDTLYYVIRNIIESIYTLLYWIIAVAVILHIFKIRYLDYYEIVKDVEKNSDNQKENSCDVAVDVNDKENLSKKNKFFLEKKNEKIVIRDPKHSEYKFFNGVGKLILCFLKVTTLFILLGFSCTMICLVICVPLCFLVIKNLLLFISLMVSFCGAILFNYVILELLYDFVVNKKWNKFRIFLTTIISFIFFGFGIGLFLVSVTEFDLVEKEVKQVESSYEFEMRDDFVIERYYDDDIEFISKDIDNIEVVVKHSEIDNVSVYSLGKNIYIDMYSNDIVLFKYIRNVIKDIGNKKIPSYSTNVSVIVYANKDNIVKLQENIKNNDILLEFYDNEIQEWKNRYDEASKREDICNQNMYEMESYMNNEGYTIEYNKNGKVISFGRTDY